MTAVDPAQVVSAFLAAMRRGDDAAVWEQFSDEARRFIVERARRRGMDAETARALLEGSADPDLRREFLAQVMAGLTKDLEGLRLDMIVPGEPVGEGDRRVVDLAEAFTIPAGPQLPPLPVASLELRLEGDAWRVERLRRHA